MCLAVGSTCHKLCQSTESSTSNIILETIRANKARQESCAREVSHCVEAGREIHLMGSSDKKWRGVEDERKRGVLKPHRYFFPRGKSGGADR